MDSFPHICTFKSAVAIVLPDDRKGWVTEVLQCRSMKVYLIDRCGVKRYITKVQDTVELKPKLKIIDHITKFLNFAEYDRRN
jgi:hypothetical protein